MSEHDCDKFLGMSQSVLMLASGATVTYSYYDEQLNPPTLIMDFINSVVDM